MKTSIGLNGAKGRVCQRIAHLIGQPSSGCVLKAALEAPGHPDLGKDYGEIIGIGSSNVKLQSELSVHTRVDALIDFSLPAGTMAVLGTCVDRRIPLVVATTGHTDEQLQDIAAASHHTPILMSPNMSLAVNLLFKLVKIAGETLKDSDFDAEIVERHHRFKKDSPSGTALRFAEIVRVAMGQKEIQHGREGLVGVRPHEEIGVHAVRVGDNPGEHDIYFSTLGETVMLRHQAHSRDSYARGALQAARFLTTKSPGMYSMFDVLGL